MSDRPFDQNLAGDPAEPAAMTEDTTSPRTSAPPVPTTPAPPPVPVDTVAPTGQEAHGSSGTDVAKDEAAAVGRDARAGAEQVAQTAKDEARQVADEAKTQVQTLYAQVRDDVSIQAHAQQQRAAEGLHGLAGELDQMAQHGEGSMASGLVGQAAQRLDGVAGWLEDREPTDLLDDVLRYARRNPGTFLAICGLVGLVGGRLTRSLRDDATDDAPAAPGRTTYEPVPDAGVYATSTGVPTAYATLDHPSDIDQVDELAVGDELVEREERL